MYYYVLCIVIIIITIIIVFGVLSAHCGTCKQYLQRSEIFPWKIELQLIVSCHVGAMAQIQVCCESSQCF